MQVNLVELEHLQEDADERILTVPEVAKVLRVGNKTVRGYIRSRGLPSLQLGTGARRVVRLSSLSRWLDAQEEVKS